MVKVDPSESKKVGGFHGNFFPSTSMPTAVRPSVLITAPLPSSRIRAGIPLMRNFLLRVSLAECPRGRATQGMEAKYSLYSDSSLSELTNTISNFLPAACRVLYVLDSSGVNFLQLNNIIKSKLCFVNQLNGNHLCVRVAI